MDIFSSDIPVPKPLNTYLPENKLEVKDTMSNFEALGYVVNTGFNMFRKSIFEQQQTTLPTTQISTDDFRRALSKETDPYIQAGLIGLSNEIDSFSKYEARKQYLQTLKNAEEQVSRNFNTAELIVAGIPFALLDIDTIPMALATAGVGLGMKSLSLTGKISNIVAGTLMGGAAGATNMYAYQSVTGIEREDAVSNAFFIGAALGGTLGTVIEYAKGAGRVTVDDTGTIVPTARELKEQAIREVQDNVKRVDEAIKIKAEIEKTFTKHEKALEEALATDFKKVKPILKLISKELEEKTGVAAKIADDLDIKIKTKQGFLKSLSEEIKTLTKESKLVDKEVIKATNNSDALINAQNKLEDMLNKRTELLNKIKDPNLVSMGKSSLIIQQIIKNNDIYQKQLVALDKEINDLNKSINKATKKALPSNELNAKKMNTSENLRAKQEEYNKVVEEINKHKEDYLAATQELKKQEAIKKSFDKNWNKTKVPESIDTKKIRDKLAKAKDYTSILQQKGLLLDEEAKMLGNDFSLLGLKEQYANKIDKLAFELKEMGTVIERNELARMPIFNEVPSIIQKMVISPIETLKASNNRYVASFASLLHNGTLSIGKTVTNTVDNIRKKMDAEWNRDVRFEINMSYKQDVKDGLFKGSLQEYSEAVSRERTKINGIMQKEAHEGIPGGISAKQRMELYAENINKAQRKYSDSSRSNFNKAVDAELNYYEKMYKRGHSLEMIGFKHTLGRAFAPRFYSVEYISKIGIPAAIESLYKAQMKFATAMNDVVSDEMEKVFLAKATTAIEETMKGTATMKAITEPFDSLVGGELKGLDTLETGRIKSRKIEVFDDDIIDLLEHDSITTSGAYALSMHGRMALKERVGIETSKELEDLMNTIVANVEEKDNIRVIVDTILGRRELTKNPYAPIARIVKGLSSASSMLHMGAFGVPTLTEITAITKEFGFNRTMAYFGEGIESVYKIYAKGEAPDLNQGKLLISYGDSMFYHKASRLESEGMLDSAGSLQHFMDKSVNKLSLLSGMAHLTDFYKVLSMSLTTDFVARASVKELTNVDYKRLLDMGFDKTDLEKIRTTLKVDKDGNIGNMDRATWGELDDRLTFAGLTTVDRTVLHPSAATLPKFMTDYDGGAFVPRLLMKFLRFPVESYERLLLRGMQQMDAKQVISLGANVAMWYAILQVKDALKPEDKRKYVGDNSFALYRDSMLSASMISAPVLLADRAYAVATGKTFTGHEASISAVTSDFARLREGKVSIGLPFKTVTLDIGEASSNILNNTDYLNELGEVL